MMRDERETERGIPIYRGRSRRKKPESGQGEKMERPISHEEIKRLSDEIQDQIAGGGEAGTKRNTAGEAEGEKNRNTAGEPEAETDRNAVKETEIGIKRKSAEDTELGAKGKTSGAKTALVCLGGVLAAAILGTGIYYAAAAGKYEIVFFPNTRINGIDVSGLSLEEAGEALQNPAQSYVLTILERGEIFEEIAGKDIGLQLDFQEGLQNLLEAQEPFAWGVHLFEESFREIPWETVFDETLLAGQIAGLSALDENSWQEPEEGKVSEYNPEIGGYEVILPWPGTEVIGEKVEEAVKKAVADLDPEVDLEAEGCYAREAVTEADESLTAAVAQLNTYVGTVIHYTFGDETETLDSSRVHQWLAADGTEISVDEEGVASYVAELAEKYNTVGKEKTLLTSYGEMVTMDRGTYGWKIDEKKEAEAILLAIQTGETQTREPEYAQRAVAWGEKEYGDTYVEINLTTQHLFFYKNGELIVDSDFVSGNEARRMATPAGAYFLFGKARNATLVGADYRTPVSYWMPFNGGIGLHDATWRRTFGGTIYKRNGSHGCVNLPFQTAKTIYENISIGDPVLCYHLDPKKTAVTETESAAIQETTAPEKPAATKPAAGSAGQPTAAPSSGSAGQAAAAPSSGSTGQTAVAPSSGSAGQTTAAPSSGSAGAGSDPASPSVSEAPVKNPAEESAAASTEGMTEGGSQGSSQAPEETTPAITAGGDKESFGPGFTDAPAVSEITVPEIGPGV